MAGLKMACLVVVLGMVAITAGAKCNPKNYTRLSPCVASAVKPAHLPPPKECCTALDAYENKTRCLCATLVQAKKELAPGLTIDLQSAFAIPKECNYSSYVPKNFKCNGVTIPTSSD